MIIPIWKLTKVFLIIKSLQLLIIYFNPVQFDSSSDIIIQFSESSKQQWINESQFPYLVNHLINNILNKFIIWDAVYFTDLFINDIKYEHQFVFCPLYWRLVKFIPIGNNNFYQKLSLSLVLNNIFHFLSSLVLFYLSLEIFKNAINNKKVLFKFAYYSSILFILSPAGVFLTSNYSEASCCLLSFTSMYFREISINHRNYNLVNTKTCIKSHIIYKLTYLLSGFLIAINYGVRANSVLLGIFFVYDLYEFLFKNKDFKNSLLAVLAGLQIFLSIILLNWYNYTKFCPERGEWCKHYIPSLFNFAQSYYWNLGFLNYWTLNNLPNFLISLPIIQLSLIGSRYFLKSQPMKILIPYILINLALLIGGIFFWHIQILIRISSFLPLVNWHIASLLGSKNGKERDFGVSIAMFFIGWSLCQTILFVSFLPPA